MSPRAVAPKPAGARAKDAQRGTPVVDVTARRGLGRHVALLRRVARTSLVHLGEGTSELSVALVGEEEIHALNRDYRGKDRPTDVLAFSLREGDGEPAPVGEAAPLGDVVISLPTAERQARERGHGVERELAELLVHGILHLLGWDHERSRADARKMSAKAREVVAAVVHGGTVGRDQRTPRAARPRRARRA